MSGFLREAFRWANGRMKPARSSTCSTTLLVGVPLRRAECVLGRTVRQSRSLAVRKSLALASWDRQRQVVAKSVAHPASIRLGRAGPRATDAQGTGTAAMVHETRSTLRRRNLGRIDCSPLRFRVDAETQGKTAKAAQLAKMVPDTF